MLVTTDLVTDQRVHKVCSSLTNAGHHVHAVGRVRKASLNLAKRPYATTRLKLFFEKGPFFYAEFNLRIFFWLLFSNADVFVANDLDTLLGVYWASRLRKKQLVLDNHEYYTGMPELVHRPRTKAIWKRIERSIFPKLRYVITDTDAKRELFEAEYQNKVRVVRNVPVWNPSPTLPEVPALAPQRTILLYQGAGINIQRGTEELTEAMQFLDDTYLLVFIGSGDVLPYLKQRVISLQLQHKVLFIDKVPLDVLQAYTRQAALGFTLDKPVSENYTCSLPNKLFDYVHAGVPVIASRLREVEKMVLRFQIGGFIDSYEPSHIAEVIHQAVTSGLVNTWKQNLMEASRQINWQNEEKTLLSMYAEIEEYLTKIPG
jgi:glycosyltransferase involved in cell wall biosynthesis